MNRTKRGLYTQIHLAVDAHGRSIRVTLTEASYADIRKPNQLIEGVNPQRVIVDKVYNADSFPSFLSEEKIELVIPPIRRKHLSQIKYDKY